MENLIILKDKDRTNKIKSIARLSDGKYEVYFVGNGRRFTYSSSNVRILKYMQTLDADKYLALIDGEVQSGASGFRILGNAPRRPAWRLAS